jgi:Domain of unknown function (DUF4376)
MKTWALYDPSTGQVRQYMQQAAEPDAICEALQLEAVEVDPVHLHQAGPYDHVAAGGIVHPVKPSPSHDWSWETKTFSLTLAKAKQAAWDEVKRARIREIDAPLATPYGLFDSDAVARDNIAKTAQGVQTFAASLAPTELPMVEFTRYDDTVVTLTAPQMIEVAKLLFEKVQIAHAKSRELRLRIQAANTLAELEAIEIGATTQ